MAMWKVATSANVTIDTPSTHRSIVSISLFHRLDAYSILAVLPLPLHSVLDAVSFVYL